MEAPETQGKRTVFMILVSSCVFFCAVKGNPTCSFPRAAKPTEVSIGSHKKVIWRCEKGHEWEAAVKTLYFLPRSPPGIMMERLCALRRRQRGRSRGSRILL